METYHFKKCHFGLDYKIIFERSYSINGNIEGPSIIEG